MAAPVLDRVILVQTVTALERHQGNQAAAARELGLDRRTFAHRLLRAREQGVNPGDAPDLDIPDLPSPDEPVEELIERLCREYERNEKADGARRLIPIQVRGDLPIGIAHFGDPHVDHSYGTDWPKLKRHVEVCQSTKGLYAANVGDMHNNWIGRLAGKYAEQSTTARNAWQLVEWLIKAVPWLYIVKGNHDLWSGAGDPLDWLTRGNAGVTDAYGVRLALRFPNGREVRVNARHDFTGHSQWNAAHGPAKAIQMGWRDHVLTCGHRHIAGYNILKCPASGLISHAIRVGSFKVIDNYAKANNFPDQNFSPCATTIIDPHARDEVGLVTVLWDIEAAADYLTWLRQRRAA